MNTLLSSTLFPLLTARSALQYLGKNVISVDDIVNTRNNNFVTPGYYQDTVVRLCERMAYSAYLAKVDCYDSQWYTRSVVINFDGYDDLFFSEFIDFTLAFVLKGHFSDSRIENIIDTGIILSDTIDGLFDSAMLAKQVTHTSALSILQSLHDCMIEKCDISLCKKGVRHELP